MMNPLEMLMRNPQNLYQQVNNFAQMISQQSNGMTPQQMVQNLLNSGKVSQGQYEQARNWVNKITGMNN